MKLKCVETYEELYHQEPFDVAFCPYRISPLGAHIDHQYGKINGLAIDKGIHMAYHQLLLYVVVALMKIQKCRLCIECCLQELI